MRLIEDKVELERPWTDDELRALRPENSSWQNPFWHGLKGAGLPQGEQEHPQTVKNATRWSYFYDGQYTTGPLEHPKTRTAFQKIEQKLALRKAGVTVHENPITGGIGVWPRAPNYAQRTVERRALEDAWEADAAQMHAAQRQIVMDDSEECGWRAVTQDELNSPKAFHEEVERAERRKTIKLHKEAEERERIEKALAERAKQKQAIPRFEDSPEAWEQRQQKQLKREAAERERIEKRLAEKERRKNRDRKNEPAYSLDLEVTWGDGDPPKE